MKIAALAGKYESERENRSVCFAAGILNLGDCAQWT